MDTPHSDVPEYLAGHLHETLAEDPRVSEQGICVTVTPGNVFLTGVVSTVERRDAITEVAHEVAPDHRIHNQVTVGAFPEPTAQEALT
ncbi:MAG TPA: BON domain-containing protein [Mycobacteriales bacterium]|jgi:osmotically-inducible protein OsmY|nr:BON domain-containing protein [Mycobacteriales bacterium]